MEKGVGAVLALTMSAGLLAGCGSSGEEDSQDRSQSESSSGEKVFYYGDTTFNAENDESDVNPHNGYSGWACIRYGIGKPYSAIPIPWSWSPGWPQNMRM